MRKGLLGVERLNSILQQYLNPPEPGKAEKEYGDHKFRVGDKVMQIKNNYQLEWEITTKYGLTVDKGMGISMAIWELSPRSIHILKHWKSNTMKRER